MGWETALFVGFSLLQASAQSKQANSDAKATVQEGTILANNKAKETLINAARLKSSFLSSGLTMEGTPMSVVNAEYDQGIKDTNLIISNTNTRSKNIIQKGRTAALTGLAKSGISAFGGSGMGADSSAAGGLSNFFSANTGSSYATYDRAGNFTGSYQ